MVLGAEAPERLKLLDVKNKPTQARVQGSVTAGLFKGLKQSGLTQYVVPDGQGFAKAVELAEKIAGNAPLSNFAVMQALPRIADMSQPDGLFVESLMAAIAQGDDAAKQRVRAFLEKRAGKVEKKS